MPSQGRTHAHRALLPAGLSDLLPPEAAHEAAVTEALMAVFAAHGYDRVKPPLVEFEESLLSGAGAAMATETFRLMDPVSQRMMALRPDITLQVARIATSRLADMPRPLRLGYAGEVLRVKGTQHRPERAFGQVGVELIGAAQAAADVEVVTLAIEALETIGVAGLTVDLNMPTLVPGLCRAFGFDGVRAQTLRAALDRKDAGAVQAAAGDAGGGRAADVLSELLAATGPARACLDRLGRIDMPGEAAAERQRFVDVAERLLAARSGLGLTVDPVEHRGFEYHTGVSFSLFARTGRGELGRGGRYVVTNGGREAATGFTFFMDAVLRALAPALRARRVYLPFETPPDAARRLRQEGWATVAALEASADPAAEARRLACNGIWRDGKIVPVDER